MKHIVLAPHLDDEVIGCYSIWNKINTVVYFTNDYRESIVRNIVDNNIEYPVYCYKDDFDFDSITDKDIVYLPSKFDFHPLHKVVRNMGLGLKGKKMFYSIEMNVPWLEEEKNSKGKLELLKLFYPKEDLFLHNAKYYLFNSIKEYDDIIYGSVFNNGYFQAFIQKFYPNEDLFEFEKIVKEINVITKSDIEFYHSLQNLIPNRLIKIITKNKIIE